MPQTPTLVALLVAILVTLSLSLFPISTIADNRVVFVLGSYSSQSNALSEQNRLTSLLGQTVEVLFDDKQSVFRVVIDEELVDESDLAGISTWRLPVGASLERVEPVPVEKKPQKIVLDTGEADDKTIQVSGDDMSPLYPEFLPGESLSAYCDRLPDSRLCLHPRMQEAIEQDRKLVAHRNAVREACQVMGDPELRAACLEIRGE